MPLTVGRKGQGQGRICLLSVIAKKIPIPPVLMIWATKFPSNQIHFKNQNQFIYRNICLKILDTFQIFYQLRCEKIFTHIISCILQILISKKLKSKNPRFVSRPAPLGVSQPKCRLNLIITCLPYGGATTNNNNPK